MSDLPEQMIRQEHVSIVTCEQVGTGKCTTTGRLLFEIDDILEPCDAAGRLRRALFELGYIHERKLDKSTQEVECLEKSSLVFTFTWIERVKSGSEV